PVLRYGPRAHRGATGRGAVVAAPAVGVHRALRGPAPRDACSIFRHGGHPRLDRKPECLRPGPQYARVAAGNPVGPGVRHAGRAGQGQRLPASLAAGGPRADRAARRARYRPWPALGKPPPGLAAGAAPARLAWLVRAADRAGRHPRPCVYAGAAATVTAAGIAGLSPAAAGPGTRRTRRFRRWLRGVAELA